MRTQRHFESPASIVDDDDDEQFDCHDWLLPQLATYYVQNLCSKLLLSSRSRSWHSEGRRNKRLQAGPSGYSTTGTTLRVRQCSGEVQMSPGGYRRQTCVLCAPATEYVVRSVTAHAVTASMVSLQVGLSDGSLVGHTVQPYVSTHGTTSWQSLPVRALNACAAHFCSVKIDRQLSGSVIKHAPCTTDIR